MSEGDSNRDIWERVGELGGRLSAVEKDQHWIKQKLLAIDSKLSWLLGILVVISSLATAAGWWMVQQDIPPLGASYDVSESVEQYLEEEVE